MIPSPCQKISPLLRKKIWGVVASGKKIIFSIFSSNKKSRLPYSKAAF
jgi:hypothetical protein